MFAVVVHTLGHEAVVPGKDRRCNPRVGRPVHGHPRRDTHRRTRTVDIYLQDTAQQITAIVHPRAHAEVLAEHRRKPPSSAVVFASTGLEANSVVSLQQYVDGHAVCQKYRKFARASSLIQDLGVGVVHRHSKSSRSMSKVRTAAKDIDTKVAKGAENHVLTVDGDREAWSRCLVDGPAVCRHEARLEAVR